MRENQTWIQNEILSVLKTTPLCAENAERFTAAWLSQKLWKKLCFVLNH